MATTWTRQSINSANQVVSSSSSTTEWSRLQIVSSAGGGNLTINDVNYITDSSGTGSLLNIDSIDATTESTLETAIDGLPNLTVTGTIGTGVWQGTAIANAYVADLPTSKITSGTFDNARIAASNVTQHQSSITGVGTISSGTWQGTVIASAYLDADTAHLSGTQTITGTKTIDSNLIIAQDRDLLFGSQPDGIYSNGTDIFIKKDDSDVIQILDDKTLFRTPVFIEEDSSAPNHVTGDGALWVKNDSPNNLYFTDDTGNDIQLTNNGSINAQASLTFGISNTNAVKIDAADVADDDYARFTANGLEGRTLAEIKSDIGTGNSALVPAAGSSGQFLKHNGTFGQVSYTNLTEKLADFDNDNEGLVPNPGSTGTTTRFLREDGSFAVPAYIANTNTNQLTEFTLTADSGSNQTIAHGNTLDISGGTNCTTVVGATDTVTVNVDDVFLTNNADDEMQGTLTIDKNSTATSTSTTRGIYVDFDHTGISASGQLVSNAAIEIELNSNTPTHVGTVNNYGFKSLLTAATSGTQNNYGIFNKVLNGDLNIGIYQQVTNGGFDLVFQDSADANNYFTLKTDANAETTITTLDNSGASGHLNIEPDGHVEFDGCGVGFDLVTPTYNASDTNVDFQTGNKQFVTFGSGNITDLNLIFPKTSGNFTLILKQDSTGSRLVTNYKVWDRNDSTAASGSATVKFAGGSNPTLTTDAYHVDIISFFYDADTEIAYGVASLDFQF